MNGGLNIVKGGGVILSLLLAYRFLSNIEKRLQQRIRKLIEVKYEIASKNEKTAYEELNRVSTTLQAVQQEHDNYEHRDLQKAQEELEKAENALQRKQIQIEWQYNRVYLKQIKQIQQNSQKTQLTDNASAAFTETELFKKFHDSVEAYNKHKSKNKEAMLNNLRMLVPNIYDATEVELSQKVNDSLTAYKENQTETTLESLKDAIQQYVLYVPGRYGQSESNNIAVYRNYIVNEYDSLITRITNSIAPKEEDSLMEGVDDCKEYIDSTIVECLGHTVRYLQSINEALVKFDAVQKRYQAAQEEKDQLKHVYEHFPLQTEEVGTSHGETEQCVSKTKETQANLRVLLSAIAAKEHKFAELCAAKIISYATDSRYIDKIIMAPTTPTRAKWALLMVFGLLGAKPVLDMVSPVSNYAKSIVCGFTAYRNKRATDTPSITAVSKRLQP